MQYCVMLVVLALAILALGLGTRAVEAMEDENRMAEMELAASRTYGDSLGERSRQVQRYRHDALGLLQAIEFASTEKTSVGERAAAAWTDRQRADVPDFPLFDAVIKLKQRQCGIAEVPFELRLEEGWEQRAVQLGATDADLAVLFQNLLDNAYEANMQIAEAAHRRIALSMRLHGDSGLRVEVANSVEGSEMPSFRTRKSAPENHGVGTRIIADVVEKLGGKRSMSFDSQRRELLVVLDF